MKGRRIIYAAAAVLAALLARFVLWACRAGFSGAAMLAAGLSCALFGAAAMRFIAALGAGLTCPRQPRGKPGPRESRFPVRHPWLKIALCAALLHALMYCLGYWFDLRQNGYSGGIPDTLERLWLRTDGPHYLGIAENWYVNSGDPRFHIVFFPLYPLCVRLFASFAGGAFAAAMLASNVFAIAAAILCYELAALDMDKGDALYAALVLSIFPGSIFLAAPMSESLFLALTLGCMLCARNKKYLSAGALGALAAFTRSAGLLLAIPIFIEGLCDYFPRRDLGKKGIALRLCGAALVSLGTLGYLYVNYSVTGAPFTFMKYQSEHWGQTPGPFFATAAYQTEGLLVSAASGDGPMACTLYLPNLVCCFGAIGMLAAAMPRLRPSYGGYALCYFAFSTGVSWLLSGPRYLAACFPLAFAAALVKGRFARALAAAALLALMAVYLGMYVLGYFVY